MRDREDVGVVVVQVEVGGSLNLLDRDFGDSDSCRPLAVQQRQPISSRQRYQLL